MQVILNKKEKEELVVKLHQENKTIRQIAEKVHMSFKDIGAIIKRIDGRDNESDLDLSNKSKATQALFLYEQGKKPVEVAIELDIPYTEVEELQQEYWALKELGDLALVYYEIRNDLDLFLRLFHIMKKLKLIQTMLRYAASDLPSLENKIRKLTNDIIELELRKKDLDNTIMLQRAQLFDLGQAITKYQNILDSEKNDR